MTTNKPEVKRYDMGECPDHICRVFNMEESEDGGFVEWEAYEALQAECEKLRSELDAHKAARIAYASEFPLGADGTPDVGSIHENIRLLKKDAEFGRSVLAKREPGKKYGCHCDLEDGMEPDGCVIDTDERHHCIYATHIDVKEQCKYWTIIATDAGTTP